MKSVRIREVRPLDDYRVELTLTGGRVVERDPGPLLAGPDFAKIWNDDVRFRQISAEGAALCCGLPAPACAPMFCAGVACRPPMRPRTRRER
jgi:hypothetical protein